MWRQKTCTVRSSEHVCKLEDWDEHVVYMNDNASPGFWNYTPLRAMGLIGHPGYQFGYEIGGYGTVVGYCNHHEPHPTASGAMECGRRFLNQEPELLRDRWRRPVKRRRR